MTTHTPGPWTNERSGNYWSILGPDRNLHGYGITSSPVASIVQTSPEAQANARLIAAAPELLAVVRYALAHCNPTTGREREWDDMVDAALAKATGE